jgi:hypothetical protein
MRAPLETAKERAKACMESGSKFVTSVSLPPEIALAGIIVAEAEQRDFSNMVEVALTSYSKQHAHPTTKQSELLAKVAVAVAANPALEAKVEKVLTDGRRESRRKAA